MRGPTLLVLHSLLLVGCAEGTARDGVGIGASQPAPPATATAVRDTAVGTRRIVVLGDSLAAGYGLDASRAFPALLETELVDRGHRVEMVNAGVSGDTTAGGRRRLEWLLSQEPDLLVVELGANDGLRGTPLDAMEANLRDIVRGGLDAGARVLLLGMRVPPNYGDDYAGGFENVYRRVAEEFDVALMPFLLVDVGGRAELNLADGIHPNAEGHRLVAAGVLPYVERELEVLARGDVNRRETS